MDTVGRLKGLAGLRGRRVAGEDDRPEQDAEQAGNRSASCRYSVQR